MARRIGNLFCSRRGFHTCHALDLELLTDACLLAVDFFIDFIVGLSVSYSQVAGKPNMSATLSLPSFLQKSRYGNFI